MLEEILYIVNKYDIYSKIYTRITLNLIILIYTIREWLKITFRIRHCKMTHGLHVVNLVSNYYKFGRK